MEELLLEYLPILIFLGLASGLSIAMVLASVIIGARKPDPEKTRPMSVGSTPLTMRA
jgi:NADH-quinone oxidoreductase subunit A